MTYNKLSLNQKKSQMNHRRLNISQKGVNKIESKTIKENQVLRQNQVKR